MTRGAVRQVLDLYPKIFFACHARHRRDPKTRRVLSAHQASILDHLDDVEPTHLLGLAAHMGVTPGTMCLAVQRLVRLGYVLRAKDRSDGRRVSLRLSAAGVRIKESRSVLEPARVAALLRRLTPAEREAAIGGLALLARAARQEMESFAARRRAARRAPPARAWRGGAA
jgi:DNA-binding MarR family transcriptional regulator